MKKRLFALFSLLALVASCSQDAEITPSTQEGGGNAVNFSASMLSLTSSRAAEPKTTWGQGDQIAIFVDSDHTTAYCYDVDSAGTMTPAEGVEPFITMATDPTPPTYLAFYPYNAEFSSAEEYQAASSEEVDMMSSIASGAAVVEFTFSHEAALLCFDFFMGAEPTSATITKGEASYSLDFELDGINASSSIFVTPTDDISDAMLRVIINSQSYYYSLSSDFTAWSQGCMYNYSGLSIATPAGSGTEEDPFLIYTADDMRNVGTDTNGWSLSAHYKLVTDIDLGGIDASGAGVAENEWTAIGAYSSSSSDTNATFHGSFDGDGHMISGIYINKSGTNHQGLFGCVRGATIKNLGVSGSITGYYYVGGIVGACNGSGSITSCYNRATISGESYCGGITGNPEGSSTTFCYITSCYSASNVTSGGAIEGGILGTNGYGGIIDYCFYNSDDYDGDLYGTNQYNITNSSSKTSEEMREADFVTLLNTPLSEAVWVQDTEGINDGYPILKL
ncbi:MAG: fimbrillin family protein [Rikenellaceae bacterium]